MYTPSPFGVTDNATLYEFIDRYDFATLVGPSAAGLVAAHIPITLQRTEGKAVLIGHLARANSQWRTFDGQTDVVVIFHGPHAYISPTWYVTTPNVPTWNYAAVHVYGKPRAREDAAFAAAALKSLVAKHEGRRGQPWRIDGLDSDVYEKLARAIVAFEMPIDRVEGKFKLGQNRAPEDRRGMLQGLDAEGSRDADALAEFIREHGKVE